jgi:tRNA modification GTPase
MSDYFPDTIAAIATAAGKGGVGIIRLSGPKSLDIAKRFIGFNPKPRHAHYCPFQDRTGVTLDEGIALYFKAPHSFTGEDVVELQGHGGPIVLDMLLNAAVAYGARMAAPGEFSQRAFLNDKLDLVQAEAVADLINSTSETAARSAMRSLHGDFSQYIDSLLKQLIDIRMFVEAAIDFPEEEIDFLADSQVLQQLKNLSTDLTRLIETANQGALLTEGIRVVIAGRPNAGKSSLLNALAGKESAIVTDIAGTTRDVLKEQIDIDGMPLHIIDTAGLREASDAVEQIGIARAWNEINQADLVLLVYDATNEADFDPRNDWQELLSALASNDRLHLIANKIDQTDLPEGIDLGGEFPKISLSAKTRIGLDLLTSHLKNQVGYRSNAEGIFTARRRHLDALSRALESILAGTAQLELANAGELLAEDLRVAQEHLGEITGKFTADDLLGEIFGSFCIGK